MNQAKKIISIFLAAVISLSAFAKSSEIKTAKLKNNIPVYIKNNDSNQIVSVYIVVKGGVALLTPDKSGLENALFSMMARGSKRYSYEKIQTLEYNTESSITASAIKEGSVLGLTCIDYYLDQMLPVLVDGFLNPVFGQNEYNSLMTEYAQQLQSIQNDPYSLMQYTIGRTVFNGTPYETSEGVTADSFSNITIENMKELHSSIIDTNRISIVAVGNFNEKDLIKKLNSFLGSIPQNRSIFKMPKVEPVKISDSPVVLSHPSSEGTGFYAEVFSAPSVTSKDYISASVCAKIYNELLFNIVREKYGACYSPGTSLTSTLSNIGLVMAYRVSDMENLRGYIKEAEDLMKQGKLISGKQEDGTYEYSSIQERLEGYKNSYLNSNYEGMQTNGGVASRIAASILQFENPEQYLCGMEKIKTVSADDVEKVFEKYWCTEEKQLFAVVGPSNLKKVKEYLK